MDKINGFEELKYYIMNSIEDIKEKLALLENQLRAYREQSLIDVVEIKTKISVYAAVVSLLISISVSLIFAVVTK